MVVVADVVRRAVHVPHVESLACASSMEAARGARGRTAREVQKDIRAFASLMAVEGVVSFWIVQRVPREAQSFARHTVEESAAHSQVVPKELKVALLSARGTVEVSAAPTRAVVYAQRVSMVGRSTVLLTVVGRGAQFQAVPRVLEGGRNTVCAMVVEGSSFGVSGPPCDKFARSKIGLCAAHSALIEDHCVHGGGSLGPATKQFTTDTAKPDEMKVTAMNGDADMMNGDDEASMGWSDHGTNDSAHPSVPMHSSTTPFPEGRVHGSGLLALLSGRSHASAENGASTSASMCSWM
ncbi:putative WRKY transcription factor 19 [Dichanthelium oligosanthes]|uniref:Putative WRKY transcription factor 19 n=1 Tax=Dichanthelium oligosanthes TaxID=888268 RepID=A0A1E5VA84_9POAL|nr:putative WRKY transcription factor 19 [Dichanthelium oligosanthes]